MENIDQPTENDVLSMLDGSVYSQGVKVSHRQWLDIGSEEWQKTSDKDKAAAYQAAKVTGWDERSIRNIILAKYKHLKDSTLDMTFSILQELEKENKIEVVEVYKPIVEAVVKQHKIDLC